MAALPDVPKLLREAVFVSVGLGLLGVNQIQVARRELTADLRRVAGSGPLGLVLGNGRSGGRSGARPASPSGPATPSGEQAGERTGEPSGGRPEGPAAGA